MKTQPFAGKTFRAMLAAIAGGCLLAPVTASARVPYQSGASRPQAAMPGSAPSPTSTPKKAASPAANCSSGDCVRPDGLGLLSAHDHRYGTTIDWLETPEAAGKLAAKESKLVFLIQLSGDFTNTEFT